MYYAYPAKCFATLQTSVAAHDRLQKTGASTKMGIFFILSSLFFDGLDTWLLLGRIVSGIILHLNPLFATNLQERCA